MASLDFLKSKGQYRHLRVYKITELIYDISYYFAHQYLRRGDRTIDQMIQAARSGKQNIAEGSLAAMSSTETEIKLTNVARASLGELLIDYEDYLRVRGIPQWGKTHPRYQNLRLYARNKLIYQDLPQRMRRLNDEELANLAITLIHQAMHLLERLLKHQQEQFVRHGGIKEQMLQARLAYRNGKHR